MGELMQLPRRPGAREKHYRPVTRGAFGGALLGGYVGVVVLTMAVMGLAPASATLGIFAAMVGALVMYGTVRRRKALEFVRANDDAVALLNRGELPQATALLEGLTQRARAMPVYHGLFVYNRGVAWLRAGEPERALAIFTNVLEAGWLTGKRAPLRGLIAAGMAAAWAQLGELGAAHAWLAEAHGSIGDARRGVLLGTDAMVALRSGQPEQALDMLDAGWSAAEGVLTVHQMRSLHLLRAFALTQVPPTQPRQALYERAMMSAVPSRADEFRGLCTGWPELAAFVHEQGWLGHG